jgi:ubiquinone/menaquinone biosynthesis C-methylase UbiE
LDTSEARRQAISQWTANPCGTVQGDDTELSYFLSVESERYRQQPWQKDYFRFDRFSGKRVLEIGVGHGTDLVQFGRAGTECHGIDITERHLLLAQRNFALRGLSVVLTKCDATAISYPDSYFDAVYSFGVIHHIPDAAAVLSEVRRVLKPGGLCMVAAYHKWSAFHIANMVLRQGLLKGDLFRLGYGGLLATIEQGADGIHVKPYVKLYTKRSMRSLMAGLQITDVSVHQLFPSHFSPRFLWPVLNPFMPILAPVLGWYVVGTAIKT